MLLSLRIEAAFKTRELDPNVFERCATDLLSTVYPHLVPVTGGSDMGRDADLGPLEGSPRLLATSDKDPMTNLLRSIDQMHAKGLRPKQVVLAISQPASATKRLQLSKAAAKKGVKLVQIFDRTWFVQQLLHSPEWRKRLLSITAPPAALVDAPIELGRRGELLPLAGRGDEVAHISKIVGDLIIVGPPGMGKTRVLAEVPGVAFLETNPDHEQLADDLDEMRPKLVVVEDAVRRPDDLRLLRRLREEETHRLFQVAITVWSDEHKEATDLLPRAEVLQLERLEQREIAAIVRGLGISNYWLLSEIIEQARGRAGWAVALSRVALRGASLSLFHGEALASEVERFLRLAGGSDESLHTLAHVALASGVPEPELPILAKRTQMPLLKLTKILHASTADGILERSWGGWIVEPAPLRAALLHRWFFASVAREPAEVLITNDDPQLVRDLLEAALAAARYGSAQAKSFAERLIKPMAEKAAAGHEGALALTTDFASIDRDAAEWAMQECILPALTRTNGGPNVRRAAARAAREAAERFLIPSAIKVVLGEALAFTRPDNDPDHPVAILAQAATRILPDTRRQVGRRAALLRPALEWLDEDPTPERWEIVAHLADSLVSPVVSGHWMNAGDPLTVTVAEGAEPVDVMEAIARDIWPEIEKRLSGAPDKAVLPLIHAAGEWLSVAVGAVMPGARVSLEQRSAARRIGQ
jgi:hypothetical protein